MTIDITPETERVIREAPRSGHFRSIDELIQSSIQVWREHDLPPKSVTNRTTGKEKRGNSSSEQKSRSDTPPLSDEAISRASLHPNRC